MELFGRDEREFDGLAALESNFRHAFEIAGLLDLKYICSQIKVFEPERAVIGRGGFPSMLVRRVFQHDLHPADDSGVRIEHDPAEGQLIRRRKQQGKEKNRIKQHQGCTNSPRGSIPSWRAEGKRL